MKRSCYKLDLGNTLEKVKELVQKNYNYTPKTLKNENLEYNEGIFFNKWYDDGEIKQLSDKIRAFSIKGSMELPVGSYKFKESGEIRNKEDRVSKVLVNVIFLEVKRTETIKETIALIIGTEEVYNNTRIHLMGKATSFDKDMRQSWKILSRPGYLNFNSEFFLWLLTKHDLKELLEIGLDIKDIHYLSHQNEIKEGLNHIDDGVGALESILGKISISMESEVSILGMELECEYGRFSFVMNHSGKIDIKESSNFLKVNDSLEPIDEDDIGEVIQHIYGFIFPRLKEGFDNDISKLGWRNEKIFKFKEKLAREAFLELGEYNKFLEMGEEIKLTPKIQQG